MSFIDRVQKSSGPFNGGQLSDARFQQAYPALFEFLALQQYPDGTKRQTASLTMFSEDGVWKACLNERETSQVLFVTESTYDVLLEALELLLQSERPPWRPSKASAANNSKGRR